MDPAVVLLILLAGDAADPATQAVLPAVRRPLGDRAIVLVQQAETEPTDAEALALARTVHAASTASFTWEDSAHKRVRLRVLRVEGSERYEYELAFTAADPPMQRGRAVGLALAPLLTQAMLGTTPGGPAADVSPPHVTPASQGPAGLPAAPVSEGSPSASSGLAADASPRHAGPTARFALDAFGVGSVGIGGNALGAGPSLGLRWFVLEPISLHAVALARFGAVPSASAFSSTAAAGGGASWSLVHFGPEIHRLGLTLSADVLAMQHTLVRHVNGSTPTRDRWLTAFDSTLDIALRVARVYELAADVGAEIATGPTAITVGGATVDHIPVVRAVAGLGVRVRF